jgi:hypothetical protein
LPFLIQTRLKPATVISVVVSQVTMPPFRLTLMMACSIRSSHASGF